MSLSVLKRKSSTKHLSSRGENGFSLNNPRRSGKYKSNTHEGSVPRVIRREISIVQQKSIRKLR